jgi:hypothetical protein
VLGISEPTVVRDWLYDRLQSAKERGASAP